jgi:hypothetical protein
MKYYLLTMQVAHACVHAYLMTRDAKDVPRAMNELCNVAERLPGAFPPIVLQTDLEGDPEFIPEMLGRHFPEIAEKMKTMKNFHLSVWMFPDDEPDNKRLMDLH